MQPPRRREMRREIHSVLRSGRLPRRLGASAVALLVVVFVLLCESCDRPPPAQATRTITLWYPWGADLGKQLKQIVGEFERTHPGIHVRLSFAANNLTSSQKLFLSIAADDGPDITFVDGQQLADDKDLASSKHKKKKGLLHKVIPGN